MKKAVKVINWILSAMLLLLLVLNLYTLAAKFLFEDKLPKILGYSSAVVVSGSMYPELNVDDLVIIKTSDLYAVGDVITYSSNNSLVTHRIIKQTEQGFITKGDANNTEDKDIVKLSQVEGKVVGTVEGAGIVINFITSPLCIFLAFAVLILLIEVPLIMHRTEEKRSENSTKISE